MTNTHLSGGGPASDHLGRVGATGGGSSVCGRGWGEGGG